MTCGCFFELGMRVRGRTCYFSQKLFPTRCLEARITDNPDQGAHPNWNSPKVLLAEEARVIALLAQNRGEGHLILVHDAWATVSIDHPAALVVAPRQDGGLSGRAERANVMTPG